MLYFLKFFAYKTTAKPNFLDDKPNIKHKPSIFTKNTMGQCWKVLRITCSPAWIVPFLKMN